MAKYCQRLTQPGHGDHRIELLTEDDRRLVNTQIMIGRQKIILIADIALQPAQIKRPLIQLQRAQRLRIPRQIDAYIATARRGEIFKTQDLPFIRQLINCHFARAPNAARLPLESRR